ncbi:MAG: glycosyltransferase family 39 protein [Proteobacteria bacterium]|nr:glycosyltransferase family 39 protein [Pseudomonadota bacterium]
MSRLRLKALFTSDLAEHGTTQIRVALGLTLAVMCLHFAIVSPDRLPDKDALRYIDYAQNLASHGVFGLSEGDPSVSVVPSNANAPLYPAFVSLFIVLDDDLQDSLTCIQNSADPDLCPRNLSLVFFVQYLIGVLGLICVFLFTRIGFGSTLTAWLALASAFVSGVFTSYAERILTENFTLTFFLAFTLCLLMLYRDQAKPWMWASGAGVLAALLTLTRPEYLYLSVGIIAVVVAAAIIRRRGARLIGLSFCAFLLVVTPWAIRNQVHFGNPTLTSGGYGETILAYRISYNRMNFTEWAASFIYWLPDFGDKAAAALLPRSAYQRLIVADPTSFTLTAQSEILEPALAAMPREQVVGYWIREEVLKKPLRFAWTSLAMTWRGLWVGKYWGLIGFFAYAWLTVHMLKRREYWFTLMSLPCWALVALHAAVSVNVPRYNLALLAFYAPAWAWLIQGLLYRWAPGLKPGATAIDPLAKTQPSDQTA